MELAVSQDPSPPHHWEKLAPIFMILLTRNPQEQKAHHKTEQRKNLVMAGEMWVKCQLVFETSKRIVREFLSFHNLLTRQNIQRCHVVCDCDLCYPPDEIDVALELDL